ncbi:MAG: hypothetical protein J3R72DRAFT_496819 [Linnemannia gamsii]|nr:MAG: hypothetical protein J3R72DRAFT_496819 [Linnemannia gamsii]
MFQRQQRSFLITTARANSPGIEILRHFFFFLFLKQGKKQKGVPTCEHLLAIGFRTPKSIAKTILHKIISFLEMLASVLIWKPRCSATIAWELTQGISAKDKTSKYIGAAVAGVEDTVTSLKMVSARVTPR